MSKLNKEIEQFIVDKDKKKQSYSQADIDYISKYTGKGGDKEGGAGMLHQFYTPAWICDIMYELALYHGYDGGNVLDPSVGTGNILQPFPDDSIITGFEPDAISYRIAQLRFSNAKLYNNVFETAFLQHINNDIYGSLQKNKLTWLQGFPFSLVITNPPYGQYHNFYAGRMKKLMHKVKFMQMEIAFMLFGVLMLRPGGLLIYITSQNFMRNNLKYKGMKEVLSQYAEFTDAYRLPDIFDRTKVTPDIIIFKRKEHE